MPWPIPKNCRLWHLYSTQASVSKRDDLVTSKPYTWTYHEMKEERYW